MKAAKWGFNMTIISGLVFLILTFIAMFSFPGGTLYQPDLTYYDFFRNFFSDLGRTIDFEGNSNFASHLLFTLAMTVTGISTGIFFLSGTRVLSDDSLTRFLKYLMAFIGILSGIGFVGVGFTPWDLGRPIHIVFVELGFYSLLAACFLCMICIYRTSSFPNGYAHFIVAICILLAGYILLMKNGPKPGESEMGLLIQATGQKIIVYSLIIATMILAIGGRNIIRKS